MTLLYWAVVAAVAIYLAAEIASEAARRRRVLRDARDLRRWEHLINQWCDELLFLEHLRDELDDRRDRIAA